VLKPFIFAILREIKNAQRHQDVGTKFHETSSGRKLLWKTEGIRTVTIFVFPKWGKQAKCGGYKKTELKSKTFYGSPIHAVCAAEHACFTIDKFTREFHFDTLYLHKITEHVDFISITTPRKPLSKLPDTSGGFNISSPFRTSHRVYFNTLHNAKSLTRRMTVRSHRNARHYEIYTWRYWCTGLNHVMVQ
jgi:hypothetical protein